MSEQRRAPAAAGAAVERWSLPEMHGPVVGRSADDRRGADTAKAMRQEAESRGHEAGLAKAQLETAGRLAALDARVRQLDSILQLLTRPLQELDARVDQELTQLAFTVGKQLARRELRVDPSQVIGIIRESLAQLPAAARDVRVQLHPEDAAVVRERLSAASGERAWTIVEDPTLSRGGCVVRSEHSLIDAKLESRIVAVMASAFGEERTGERQADPPAGATPGDAK